MKVVSRSMTESEPGVTPWPWAMRRCLTPIVWCAIVTLAWGSGGGCARWKKETEEKPYQFLENRMSPDSVVLEVMSLEVPADRQSLHTELWAQLDETSFPVELRRRLADNGLRCGIASTRLPASVEELLQRQRDESAFSAENAAAHYGTFGWGQRWQARLGHPKRFALSDEMPSLTWVVDSDGYFEGQSRQQARCQVEIVAYPQADGKVRIDVVPEIEYGPEKQQYGVSEQAFVVTVARDREIFNAMRMSAELIAGQTLIVSQSTDDAGLGHVFFGNLDSGSNGRKILLIRVAQTQLDELFSREQIFAPIETPTE